MCARQPGSAVVPGQGLVGTRHLTAHAGPRASCLAAAPASLSVASGLSLGSCCASTCRRVAARSASPATAWRFCRAA
eukprot:290485-Chlamydomonas_euryale.AAC.1